VFSLKDLFKHFKNPSILLCCRRPNLSSGTYSRSRSFASGKPRHCLWSGDRPARAKLQVEVQQLGGDPGGLAGEVRCH